jgi:hypothetical protein
MPAVSDRASTVLRRAARTIAGVVPSPSQFSPIPALWVDGREFAHVHGERLEIRLTRPVIRELRGSLGEDDRVTDVRRDWLSFAVRGRADESDAMDLLRTAADANRREPAGTSRISPREAARARRPLHRAPTDDVR